VSRKLKRAATRLEYETTVRVREIGRLLREYRRELQIPEHSNDPSANGQTQREIDRVLGEYLHLNKRLRRVRRKS
jgi:hypothetical protein